jgi:hypothetical protein
MTQIKKLSVVLLDLGVSALVLGGIVAPTQAAPDMGSVVVEQQPPASGSGPSIPTYQVVVPGPNPAQNTGVGVGQELSTPGSPVTVYPTPAP